MQLLRLNALSSTTDLAQTAVTIGNFDGVHVGHQAMIQQLKEVAEKNNRSMESQVRSILEEWLAGTVAHEITRKTNFYDEIREFMKNMDFEGLDKGELPLSERNSADSRPPVSFE